MIWVPRASWDHTSGQQLLCWLFFVCGGTACGPEKFNMHCLLAHCKNLVQDAKLCYITIWFWNCMKLLKAASCLNHLQAQESFSCFSSRAMHFAQVMELRANSPMLRWICSLWNAKNNLGLEKGTGVFWLLPLAVSGIFPNADSGKFNIIICDLTFSCFSAGADLGHSVLSGQHFTGLQDMPRLSEAAPLLADVELFSSFFIRYLYMHISDDLWVLRRSKWWFPDISIADWSDSGSPHRKVQRHWAVLSTLNMSNTEKHRGYNVSHTSMRDNDASK